MIFLGCSIDNLWTRQGNDPKSIGVTFIASPPVGQTSVAVKVWSPEGRRRVPYLSTFLSRSYLPMIVEKQPQYTTRSMSLTCSLQVWQCRRSLKNEKRKVCKNVYVSRQGHDHRKLKKKRPANRYSPTQARQTMPSLSKMALNKHRGPPRSGVKLELGVHVVVAAVMVGLGVTVWSIIGVGGEVGGGT